MRKKINLLFIVGSLFSLTGCGNNAQAADRVIFSNIITMDENNPNAEAVAIKDGKILALGNKEEIKAYIGSNTKVDGFSSSYLFPGLIDGHAHPSLMSTVKVASCVIPISGPHKEGDLVAYAKIMNNFIQQHKDYEVYEGYGFWVTDNLPTASILDQYCITDKPVVIIDGGGHSAWLNTAAINKFIGDTKEKRDAFIETFSRNCVIVDINDNPTGYVIETPRYAITDKIGHSVETIKNGILDFQEVLLKEGYTTILDCSIVENDLNKQVTAFKELEAEGKLKLRYYAYYEVSEYNYNETYKTPKEYREHEMQKAIELHNTLKGDHFQIIGIKAFLDGVPEALTAWTSAPYPTSAGKGDNYHGVARWLGKEVELEETVYTANSNGLSVQLHAFGDAAIHLGAETFDKVQTRLKSEGKNTDCRNGLAHCGLVGGEDDLELIRRSNTSVLVPPQWSSVKESTYGHEKDTFGNRADEAYKVKTYIDKGINTSFHTDGMVRNGAPELFFAATTRLEASNPAESIKVRGENEKVDAMTALKCMTINPSYIAKQENNLGKIKVGMTADFTIYNNDYSRTEVCTNWNNFANAKEIALVVGGEFVYSVF